MREKEIIRRIKKLKENGENYEIVKIESYIDLDIIILEKAGIEIINCELDLAEEVKYVHLVF